LQTVVSGNIVVEDSADVDPVEDPPSATWLSPPTRGRRRVPRASAAAPRARPPAPGRARC